MATTTEITSKAIEKVRDNNIEYYQRVLDFAEKWVKTKLYPFTSEDLKEAFYAVGNPKAVEPRVFGAVFRNLASNKLIFSTDRVKKYTNPTCHQRPQTVWISFEYRLSQQQKPKKETTMSLFH